MSGPPPGGPPAIGSGPNLGKEVLVVVWTLSAISGLVLAVRLYCKIVRNRGLWWDDYMLILAWIFLIAPSATTTVEVQLGFGHHVWAIDPRGFPTLGPLGQVTACFSILGALFSKVSFAITLLRLCKGWLRAAVWGIIGSMSVFMLLSAIFIWTQCTPVAKIWTPDMPGTCWDPTVVPNYNVFSGVYSGFMDICLALLPWPIILNLQMTKKEKFGVAIAMSLGLFAGITGFIKSSKIPSLASGDFTFDGVPLVEWGAAETATTIIATSIPILRALFSELRKNSSKRYFSKQKSVNDLVTSSTVHGRPRLNTGLDGPSRNLDPKIGGVGDNASDKSILGSPSAIVKTSEITLHYDGTPDLEDGLEMGHYDRKWNNAARHDAI